MSDDEETPTDPATYVEENRDRLHEIIKHSDDAFTRALALAVLVEGSGEPAIDDLQDDIEESRGVLG